MFLKLGLSCIGHALSFYNFSIEVCSCCSDLIHLVSVMTVPTCSLSHSCFELCYMNSGTGVGCGYMSKCPIHLIFFSRRRGHGNIFIFLSIFLLFSWIKDVYKVH